MKKPTETNLVHDCLLYLKIRQIFAWRNNTVGVFDPKRQCYRKTNALKGVADILGILPGGVFLAVECKMPKGKITPDQQYFINQIRMMKITPDQQYFINQIRMTGGVGLLVRSVRQLEDALIELGYR